MANLKTDSPISPRIATAFLDFLKSVEPAAGVDVEGLEVVKEVLEEVFKLHPSSIDDRSPPGLLRNEMETDPSPQLTSTDFPSTSSLHSSSDKNLSEASKSLGKDTAEGSQALEASEDELLRQFLGALDRVGFFNSKNGEDDSDKDLNPVDTAVGLFHEEVAEMRRSGIQLNLTNLADTLKSRGNLQYLLAHWCILLFHKHFLVLGNKAVQSKSYSEAIDLYSYVIALCENNAVYYCNRLVYYAQGNYRDAISKGFNKDRNRSEQQPQPEIRMDINIELQETLPEEIMGSLRSMMGMFTSGGVPQSQQQPQQPEGDMNSWKIKVCVTANALQ
ncbi:hypothetical protein MKX01_035219 [Papaver californicum]|nr:hypothetical protein MKX01_035219 [Papaver californicum]